MARAANNLVHSRGGASPKKAGVAVTMGAARSVIRVLVLRRPHTTCGGLRGMGRKLGKKIHRENGVRPLAIIAQRPSGPDHSSGVKPTTTEKTNTE